MALCVGATGCQQQIRRPAEFGPCYPPAPHTPRIQHLRSFTGGSDFIVEGGGLWRRLFGGSAEAGSDLLKPHGLAARDGRLYVCDAGRGAIFVFDFAGGSFDRWEHSGIRLSKPVALRITDTGELQVCDAGLGAVVRFAPDGRLAGLVDLAALREASSGAGIPDKFIPISITDGPDGHAAVLNRAAHRIELIEPATGHHAGSWSGPGSGPDHLYFPAAAAGGPGGTVWCVDRMNRHVLALAPDGSVAARFGEAGDQPGYLNQPRGIAADQHGVIYLTDAGLPGIQLFDRDGTFLTGFGYPGDPGPAVVLPAGICLDRSCLPYFAELIRPGFAAEYLIFVADQLGPHRIHVYAFGTGATAPSEPRATALARRPG